MVPLTVKIVKDASLATSDLFSPTRTYSSTLVDCVTSTGIYPAHVPRILATATEHLPETRPWFEGERVYVRFQNRQDELDAVVVYDSTTSLYTFMCIQHQEQKMKKMKFRTTNFREVELALDFFGVNWSHISSLKN